MNHHDHFFALLSITMVLLVAALLSPALLGVEGTSGFTASISDAFLK
jgi:hypothetical protein